MQSVRQGVGVDELPGRLITDLVVDRNGLLWLSGDQGIAYLPNPARVFTEVVLVKPIFERQFLLRDEYVTCLAVDGGNRKWVGTRNGLWLFSEIGEELVQRFTAENSPLISDVVLDIAINPLERGSIRNHRPRSCFVPRERDRGREYAPISRGVSKPGAP